MIRKGPFQALAREKHVGKEKLIRDNQLPKVSGDLKQVKVVKVEAHL